MGIKGLSLFIQQKYPQVLKSFPKRWASPELKNTKIALDGSLLTNRFFFSSWEDETLETKKVIIGWHALITRLRNHHIHPIVVYDERGVREWKSQETQRRLSDRSLHLARSLHEDRRLKRHIEIQVLLRKCNALEEGQRDDLKRVLKTWEESNQSVEELDSILDRFSKEKKEEGEGEGHGNDVGKLIQQWWTLRDDCRSSSRPFIRRKPTPPPTTQTPPPLIEEITDEESTDLEEIVQQEEDDPMPPSREYMESPRQTAMTAEEDVLLEQMLQMAATSGLPQTEWTELCKSLNDLISRSRDVAKTHDKGLDTPSVEDHEETKELLQAMGVPVIEAAIPYEAEGVASALARAGMVDWVGTEDSDVLAYEAPLLRNVTVSSKPLVGVNGMDVRKAIGLDEKSFLDLMTLFGNDAIKRIYGVGPIKAFKYLQKYGSIEGILQKEDKIRLLAGEGYLQDVHVSRKMFGQLPPIPTEAGALQGQDVDVAQINRFLKERHGLEVEQLESFIDSEDEQIGALTEGEIRDVQGS